MSLKDSIKAAPSALPAWAAIIPETYYDLIARIPAGALLFLSLVLIFDLHEKVDHLLSQEYGTAVRVAFPLIVVYVLSIMLSGLGYLIYAAYYPRLWRRIIGDNPEYLSLLNYADDTFQLGLPRTRDRSRCNPKKLTRENFRQLGLIFHDFLNEQGYTLVAKMRAEAALCTNVSAAALVSAAAYLTRLDWRLWAEGFGARQSGATMPPLVVLGLMLAAFAVSAWASYYRHGQRIRRYFSLLEVVKFGGE